MAITIGLLRLTPSIALLLEARRSIDNRYYLRRTRPPMLRLRLPKCPVAGRESPDGQQRVGHRVCRDGIREAPAFLGGDRIERARNRPGNPTVPVHHAEKHRRDRQGHERDLA